MATPDETNAAQPSTASSDAPEAGSSKKRLCLLVSLLALALFALYYDYKVARPAVEKAYEQVASLNSQINNAAEHRRMKNTDVQEALGRTPNETFQSGIYTVEAYRWSAGMPLEFRGLSGGESPGIGRKTHDYYAVYRRDGADFVFSTHFKFDLDHDELTPRERVAAADDEYMDEEGTMEMGSDPAPGPGGGPGGGGGGGVFDPEAFFTERDADSDGKLAGDEISDRMRERLESIDTDEDGAVSKEEFLAGMSRRRGGGGGPGGEGGGRGRGPGGGEGGGEGRRQRPPLESDEEPAAETPANDAPPVAEPAETPAEPAPEAPTEEAKPEAPAEPSEAAPAAESTTES